MTLLAIMNLIVKLGIIGLLRITADLGSPTTILSSSGTFMSMIIIFDSM